MSTNRLTEPSPSPRNLLGFSSRLLLAGQILYIAVTQFHAGGDANDHHHIFATYAENAIWTAVHLGQFAGIAMLLAGLVTLSFVLDDEDGTARWLGRVGGAVAVAALALYGALQAVDGVALKQAVNAWASAPETEKAARFAGAEAIRWLEWGMRSYQDFAMGLALLFFAAALARTAWITRPAGWLMGLCGLAYLAQGWVAGTQGFAPAQSVAIVLSWVLGLAWMIWLAVAARRRGAASSAA
ncbi:hypothetical protein RFN28_20075 [Mesorhizobium sp. VK24D]|uniref:DUF4386 domain-containing protein n=1 Tax=Mesorhizobium album TaxID=3072314 RepID=A0ABU4Y1B3_9HYPH|nr:hypothetical protein [Mesorhizobium sp. VK24D]MDX8480748.1 hypothetical protein [Mesorhizobium sp. VK24D]